MIKLDFSTDIRNVKEIIHSTDLVVAGGGVAGTCAAIAAAREGISVVLIQDRPVLGGNASSEVRLWILGATSHMGNNNRWSREGGVIDELLVENMYKNKEGNPVIFDSILIDKVAQEKNITLLLNTSVYEVSKSDDSTIKSITAFCSQNSTKYTIEAKFFCDATGDGIISFMAGAPFRIGAETKEEFGELFAPEEKYGHMLGHTIYFYSKDVGKPVKYIAPEFALKDITQIPRYKVLSDKDYGCRLWWLEYGGRKDTIHESEDIKWELWKVVYGVWDYIKNSGNFPEAENLTLEWVGTVPGKRESRRFEGHYMIKQQDIIEQKHFDDAVAFGGWAMDLHPADGVYSALPGCTQWHSKGVYKIPFSTMFGTYIHNLFYAGRIISSTHVAFGSTRVMATCGHMAQAVGVAASICIKDDIKPIDILNNGSLKHLQNRLNLSGQSIPGLPIDKRYNLATKAKITTSSTLLLSQIPFDGPWLDLATSSAQMLPLKKGSKIGGKILVRAKENTTLTAELRISGKASNYTPEITLEKIELNVPKGEQYIKFDFAIPLPDDQYAFITFMKNELIEIKGSEKRYTGILSVFNGKNKAVSNNGKQTPPDGIGIDSFEFWIPKRRPEGNNIAMEFNAPLEIYSEDYLVNGFTRPWLQANAWAAEFTDNKPSIDIAWGNEEQICEIGLYFDTDYDHPMESSLMGHPESVVPFCIRDYRITDAEGNVLYEAKGNYQTINKISFDKPITTNKLTIEVGHPSDKVPASLFQIVIN